MLPDLSPQRPLPRWVGWVGVYLGAGCAFAALAADEWGDRLLVLALSAAAVLAWALGRSLGALRAGATLSGRSLTSYLPLVAAFIAGAIARSFLSAGAATVVRLGTTVSAYVAAYAAANMLLWALQRPAGRRGLPSGDAQL